MDNQNVYTYILSEETRYQTVPIPVMEGYEWSMFEHCKRTLMYLNSRYEKGNFGDKPFNNIILDKINLQHRAVDIDVKDVQVYVDNPEEYYKSFLVRKYHERWARKNDLGEFFNDMAETWTDYGGVIVKNCYDGKPVVVPFNTIAFVDQSSIEDSPICIKHFFTPDGLKEYDGKWYSDAIDEVITLAGEQHQQKETQRTKQKIETPTAYIEVYELHGVLPAKWVKGYENEPDFTYKRQCQVVAYYWDKDGKKQGITLYSGTEAKNPFKVSLRDKIAGRGLGRGGVEELFEAQVWVNYSEIQQKEMLDIASKILFQTADPAFGTRNQTRNLQQGQILTHEENKPLSLVNNAPINLPQFREAVDRWNLQAKTISASFDSISGEESKSGTPFRLGLLQNQEAHSLHLYRKEKLGLFLQKVYRDWILPYFAEEMAQGDTFLVELSLDEVEAIAEQIVTKERNNYIKSKLFDANIEDIDEIIKLGNALTPEAVAQVEEVARENFMVGGKKKFIKIFKDELKDLPTDVEVIITGENKNNAFIAEKLSAIFAQIAQNPALLNDPLMERLFNEIIEVSGISPMSFSTLRRQAQQPAPTQPVASPPAQVLPTTPAEETAVA